jgi:hypothetical protein
MCVPAGTVNLPIYLSVFYDSENLSGFSIFGFCTVFWERDIGNVVSSSLRDSNQTHIHVHIPTYVAGVACSHVSDCVSVIARVSPKTKTSPKMGVIGSYHGESLNSHLVEATMIMLTRIKQLN